MCTDVSDLNRLVLVSEKYCIDHVVHLLYFSKSQPRLHEHCCQHWQQCWHVVRFSIPQLWLITETFVTFLFKN